MTTTLVTLTGDVTDAIGTDFDPRRTKAYVRHNTPKIVTDEGPIHLGGGTVNVESDGTFTLPNVVASTSLVENLQATVYVDYADPTTRQRATATFGPYDLSGETGTVDVRDLEAVQALDPSFASETMAAMQELLDQVEEISGLTGEDDAVALLINTPSSGTATSLSASYGRGAVDVRSFGAQLDGTTDDAPAIQAALDTGLDVYIARLNGGPLLDVKVGSTLTMDYANPGQRFVTIGARLLPSFVGDCLHLDGDLQHAEVLIEGSLQPGAGDFSEVAGIRIGSNSTGTYLSPSQWPFQASVARSSIRGEIADPFKGNGIIWENGPLVDFTQAYISDVTHDGIRAGGVSGMWDANHGVFIGTHVVRAGRYGYRVKRRVTEANEYEDSRFNKFIEAKAYDCGTKDGGGVTTSGGNFLIETNSNWGSIFSELGILSLTGDSYGNKLEIEPFNAMSSLADDDYGHEDFGQGNQLSGMSPWEHYETINARFHRSEWNARFPGVRFIEQLGANFWIDKIVDGSGDAAVDHDGDGTHTRIDRFNGQVALPGDTERVIIADSATGILTVPAATTVAAGATWTSAAIGEPISQFGNGWATMFDGSSDLLVAITVTGSYESKVTVRNLSGSGIDISGKMIRWTVFAYRD